MTQQTPAILPPITDPGVHDQIDRLARRYVEASGLGIELLNSIGATAEGLITRVPESMRQRLDRITLAALNRALDAASGSRRVLRERGDWFNRLAASVSGAGGRCRSAGRCRRNADHHHAAAAGDPGYRRRTRAGPQ